MSLVQGIVTFLCLWWVVWLAALPFGVQRDDNPHPLQDPGAPKHPHFLPKFIVTTLLSLLLTIGIMYMIESGIWQLHIDDPNLD